jgi:hypothetical protein
MSNKSAVQMTAQKATTSSRPADALLQRKCGCGQRTIAGSECKSCKKEEDDIALQRAATNTEPVNEVPPIVHEVLRSTGQPLDAATRAFMESRFNHDFSRVRVHTDASAAESARSVNALAYTVGHDVVFGAGQFAPNTSAGQRLTAHELAHTIQQSRNTALTTSILRVGEPNDRYEQEADRIASQVLATPPHPAVSGAPGENIAVQSDGKRDLSFTSHVAQRADGGPVGLSLVSNTGAQKHLARATATLPDKAQSTVNNDAAQAALLDWKDKALTFLDGTRRWLNTNWTAYLTLTSGNPSLAWQDSFIYSTVSNAFGNSLNDTAKAAFGLYLKKKAVKAGVSGVATGVGGAVGSVPGAIIGFVVGVLIETIAGVIFDTIAGKNELDEAAAQGGRITGLLAEAQIRIIEKESDKAKSELELEFQTRYGLTSTSDQAKLDAIQKWAEEESKLIKAPPNPDDLSLYARMIHDWILEHAGDEEHENKTTPRALWQKALETAKDPTEFNKDERKLRKLPPLPKAMKAGEDLNNHPEIFAYQTRAHWNQVGLPLYDEAQQMIDKVPDLVAKNPPRKIPHFYMGDPYYPQAAIKDFFKPKKFIVTETKQPELLIELISNAAPDFTLTEEQKQKIRKGEFTLTCQLDLIAADGSVYVNQWKYVIQFKGELPKFTSVIDARTGVKVWGAPAREIYFSVFPDRRLGW